MKSKEVSFIEFISLVALLMALVSFSINMLLPAFHDISTSFELSNKNQIQLSISLLYLGLGASQLIYGSLSDNLGRKPTVYIGLLLFLLGCIISFLSQNLTHLLIGQVIQGMGLGAPRVISLAIVRDRFEGNIMAKAMSFIMVIYILTPTLSPIIGKSILLVSNWRLLFLAFIVLGACTFILFKYRMPETLAFQKRKSFTLKHILNASLEVIKNKASLSYIIILGLYSGVFITYLNLSQPIFEFQYQLKSNYPYYFAFLALSIGVASFLNGKLVLLLGMVKLVKIAITTSLITTVLFSFANYYNSPSLGFFVIFMFIQLFSYGVLVGNLSSLSIQPLGHIAGLGASIIGAVSTLLSVPLSILIGHFYNHSVTPIVIGYLIVGVISIVILKFYTNKTK